MKFLRNTITAALIAVGITLVPMLPAQAADGWVYVVVNNRVCGQSGVQVRGILMNDLQSGWTTSTKWDNGDNIIYPRVRLGVKNQLSIQVRCEKKVALFFWQPVGYRTLTAYITPTKTGQTFWVG